MTYIRTLAALIIGVLLSAHAVSAHEHENDFSADEAAIEKTVFNYLEGFFEADIERLKSAFDPRGQMVALQKDPETGADTLKVWALDSMLEEWAKRKPIPMKPNGKILSLEIKNGQMATVIFDSNSRFYDFLTLVKLEGEWKIINKAFIRQ